MALTKRQIDFFTERYEDLKEHRIIRFNKIANVVPEVGAKVLIEYARQLHKDLVTGRPSMPGPTSAAAFNIRYATESYDRLAKGLQSGSCISSFTEADALATMIERIEEYPKNFGENLTPQQTEAITLAKQAFNMK